MTLRKELFPLLIRESGLGIEELSIKAPREYEISKKVTQPLVNTMVIQSNTLPDKEGKTKRTTRAS